MQSLGVCGAAGQEQMRVSRALTPPAPCGFACVGQGLSPALSEVRSSRPHHTLSRRRARRDTREWQPPGPSGFTCGLPGAGSWDSGTPQETPPQAPGALKTQSPEPARSALSRWGSRALRTLFPARERGPARRGPRRWWKQAQGIRSHRSHRSRRDPTNPQRPPRAGSWNPAEPASQSLHYVAGGGSLLSADGGPWSPGPGLYLQDWATSAPHLDILPRVCREDACSNHLSQLSFEMKVLDGEVSSKT